MSIGISSFVWLFIFAPVVYLLRQLVLFYKDFRRKSKSVLKLPGPPPHWLWGHVHLFPGPGEEGLLWLRDRVIDNPRCGKIFYGPFVPASGFWHPENLKTILKTSEPKPLQFGGYRFIKPWLGDGLLISHGKRWARNRRLLTPAFHFDTLKPYIAVYNKSAEVLLSKIQKFAEEDSYFEVCDHISQLTLDILLRCACSYDNDVQIRGSGHPYLRAVTEMGVIAVDRILKPWTYPDFIFYLTSDGRRFKRNCNYVHNVAEDVIRKRRQTLDDHANRRTKSGGKYMDFLDILLTAKDDSGNGLTDIEIRNEVDTFMFEGHDTTSSAISWALYSLAKHQVAQRKCQEEIDQIMEGRNDDIITWEDIPKFHYLALCLKESLRLHTTVPIIMRETTKDMTMDGYHIPAGTIVDIHLWNLHHNQEIWGEDDLEFKPERMLQENLQKMDTYSHLPFSAGPRNCIGQHFALHEMKVVIARILHKFTLELDPFHPVKRRIAVVMKTENGIMIKAKPRIPSQKISTK